MTSTLTATARSAYLARIGHDGPLEPELDAARAQVLA